MFCYTFASKLAHIKSLAQGRDTLKRFDDWIVSNLDTLYADKHLREYFIGEKPVKTLSNSFDGI